MWIFPIIFLTVISQIKCDAVINVGDFPLKALFRNDASSSTIDDLFKKFLEELRGVMKNGSKFFGIPPLDPYKSGPVNESLNVEDIKGNMSADSITVFDLSSYDVIEGKIQGLTIKMGFQWTEIEGNLIAYNITNGRFMNFVDVFGNGNAAFNLEDLQFSTEIILELRKMKISIKSMESQVSLGSLKFYTDGLYNNTFVSEEMSAVISEIGPEFLQTYQKDLTAEINKRIMDIANKFLSHISLNDLIDTISSKFPQISNLLSRELLYSLKKKIF